MSKKKKYGFIQMLRRIFPMVYKASPGHFWLNVILRITNGLFLGIQIIFYQRLFDAATNFTNGRTVITEVFIALIALVGIIALVEMLDGFGDFEMGLHGEITTGRLGRIIGKKITQLPAECFEDTETLDHINKAAEGRNNAFGFVLSILSIFTFFGSYFTIAALYLFSLKPIFVFAIILIFIPTTLSHILRTKVFNKLEDKSAPIRRESAYYEGCITDRGYYKETRQLGGYRYFKKLFIDSVELANKLRFKANLKSNLAEFSMKILTIAGYVGILFMLFVALMNGEVTVGAFAAVFASLGALFGYMDGLISWRIGNMSRFSGTINNFLSFLDLPERKGSNITLPECVDITLSDVCFAYPKAEKNVVCNVSLTIRGGEIIAIVGENGSGKSTLIRLILGLYLPSVGTVEYGSINTQDISPESLFGNSSAVFQRYQKYQMTLRENVTISQLNRDITTDGLVHPMEQAGINPTDKIFPNGYDTMLCREFDGIDLSGGEWQRVAIARGLYRMHGLVVLDEPTAAIDPLEETQIYNRFAKISKNKTAIIVTHRLGSVRLADRIVVMKNGEVVEIGGHAELLANGGEYTRMYGSQQQWYKEGESAL